MDCVLMIFMTGKHRGWGPTDIMEYTWKRLDYFLHRKASGVVFSFVSTTIPKSWLGKEL